MPTITARAAVEWMKRESRGRIFGISFVKRTTGQIRVMAAKYGVRKYVTGWGAAYDFEDHGLTCVCDAVLLAKGLGAKSYRCVPTEGLVSITINKVKYEVIHSD